MMERKKILAGNWKMNLELSSAMELTKQISIGELNHKIIHLLFPPYIFLNEVCKIVKKNNIYTGSQNCSSFDSGAFTGEISARMIKSCGADYCLIGHSERRSIFGEDNKTINLKIRQCISNDIKPILCVGESFKEREGKEYFDIVAKQIIEALTEINIKDIANLILAYEPVWAIGTGLTATPLQAQEMHSFIREKIKEIFGSEFANNLPILYGGSCNSSNAKELFSCKDVDGGLIGSASLKAEEFIKLSNSF